MLTRSMLRVMKMLSLDTWNEDAFLGYMKCDLSTLLSSEVQAVSFPFLSFNLFIGELE